MSEVPRNAYAAKQFRDAAVREPVPGVDSFSHYRGTSLKRNTQPLRTIVWH